MLFDGAEELDFVGPWEVLTAAVALCREKDAEYAGRVVTVAERERPIRAAKGMRVVPDHTFADAPSLDVILVPGGDGRRTEVSNQAMLDYLRASVERCSWVTSVCTGVFLLEAIGIVHGKRVTTHWSAIDELRNTGRVEVVDGVRFVRAGEVVTAAGVSAGIDMALWLVGQIFGIDHARTTQHYIQYDPAPPYTAEV
ncbi:MAG: DJ-1/PfpI family protein [Myxococcota bacterium]